MFQKTVRVVINFKKTQKTIVRVSPHAPLQELAPIICSKCEFDPLHTLLLKDYQSQEPLDMTKSLNDLGLRELYAMDVNRGKLLFVLLIDRMCVHVYMRVLCLCIDFLKFVLAS